MGVYRMMEIVLIELITIVSFLYSTLMIFISFAPANEMVMLFLWTLVCSMTYALNYRKSKRYEAVILLLLLPIILYHDLNSVFFILITTILIVFYVKKYLNIGAHYLYVNRIKTSYLIYIPLIYIRSVIGNFNLYMAYSVPFIILYILSSIILSRTIRHLDSNMDMRNIRKNNIRNILIISVVFALVTFERLRGSLFEIGNKILTLIYYPLYLFGKIIGKVFDKIEIEGGIVENAEEILEQMEAEQFEIEQLEALEGVAKKQALDLVILKNILGIILIIVAIYIIYRLIKKRGNRNYESLEYVEEREYIKESKDKEKKFKRDRYPKELSEQIRYYYRKFLDKLEKKDIEILKTDSSLEINDKAEEVYGEEIDRIREIYINSRYSDRNVDKNLVQEMKDLYKKL